MFNEISFHDSLILEVREKTADQTLDFLIDFPVDWQNDIFEKKILRFKGVIVYTKTEIPFAGEPTILEINFLNSVKHTFEFSTGSIEISRYKVEMATNAGSRFIEFSESELLPYS